MEAWGEADHNMGVGLKNCTCLSRSIGKRVVLKENSMAGDARLGCYLIKENSRMKPRAFYEKGPFRVFASSRCPESQARGWLIASPCLSLSGARPCCGMSLLAATVPCSACLPNYRHTQSRCVAKSAPKQISTWDLHLPVTGRCRSQVEICLGTLLATLRDRVCL